MDESILLGGQRDSATLPRGVRAPTDSTSCSRELLEGCAFRRIDMLCEFLLYKYLCDFILILLSSSALDWFFARFGQCTILG